MKNEIKTINRRGFLEHSAKITAAGFLMSRLPAGSKKLISFEGEIKVALINWYHSYLLVRASNRFTVNFERALLIIRILKSGYQLKK